MQVEVLGVQIGVVRTFLRRAFVFDSGVIDVAMPPEDDQDKADAVEGPSSSNRPACQERGENPPHHPPHTGDPGHMRDPVSRGICIGVVPAVSAHGFISSNCDARCC